MKGAGTISRIGVYGGTFDPIHFGHLRPALEVMEACHLDQVRFVPCSVPVHREAPLASAEDRLAMIQRAIEPVSAFVLDRREILRAGPSYMVDTLASLREAFPEAQLVLILGQDAFAQFHRWHRWQKILALASVVVTRRPGSPMYVPPVLEAFRYEGALAQLPPLGGIGLLEVTQLDISSTDIRARLRAGQRVDYLLPHSVIEYIRLHRLYQSVLESSGISETG